MLIKIDRQEAIAKFPILPTRRYDSREDEYIFNYPKTFSSHVLTVPSKSFKGHIKLLGTQIAFLAANLGHHDLVFIGDIDTAWLRRFNTYDSFQESLQYLSANKIGKRFNGAIQVGTTEIPAFIKHLAWLIRTNGILPFVHFTDPGQNIMGVICQYGNLHISARTKASDKKLRGIIAKSQFTYLHGNQCFDRFSKRGQIRGRTIAK